MTAPSRMAMIPAVWAQSAPARNQSFAPAVIRAACWGYCVALSAALENDLVSWFWTSLFTWSALGLSSRAYRGVEFSDIAQGSIAAGPGTRVGHLGGRGRLYDHDVGVHVSAWGLVAALSHNSIGPRAGQGESSPAGRRRLLRPWTRGQGREHEGDDERHGDRDHDLRRH